MQSLAIKSLYLFVVILALPLVAKPKSCRGSLTASEASKIHLYPEITRDFETALKKAIPEVDNINLVYFLSTLYNAALADDGIPALREGLPFKALSKLPYPLQLEYFTRLKHHPFLRETPPTSLEPLNPGGTPQYLPKNQREIVLKLLEKYDLPDIEGDLLKFAPIKEDDLEGATLEVLYSSNTRDLLFQIDIADDGTAVAHVEGEIFTAGDWRLENGSLKIDGEQKIQIDLRRATQDTLYDAHTEVARIHEWGPFALIQVRYLRDENSEALGESTEFLN